MVHIVGAGCGAADLITVRGVRLLEEADQVIRSEEHTSELQSPDNISYAVFCLKKKFF